MNLNGHLPLSTATTLLLSESRSFHCQVSEEQDSNSENKPRGEPIAALSHTLLITRTSSSSCTTWPFSPPLPIISLIIIMALLEVFANKKII